MRNTLETLRPWQALDTPVEEIGQLGRATCWTGLVPGQQYEAVKAKLGELGAAIEQIGVAGTRQACLIVALNENGEEVQKVLRAAEFETVSFEGMTGLVIELINKWGTPASKVTLGSSCRSRRPRPPRCPNSC